MIGAWRWLWAALTARGDPPEKQQLRDLIAANNHDGLPMPKKGAEGLFDPIEYTPRASARPRGNP